MGRRESFIDRLLTGEPPQIDDAPVGRQAYAARIVTGGFSDAQGRSARGRARFFDSYIASILGRDLQDIASVRDTGSVERLLRLVAARSASLVSSRAVAVELGADHKTVAAQTRILENLFLVSPLRPWGVNLETFAAMELARQCDWAESSPSLFHYRDKQQREVDIVLELGSGEIAGVEIKTAASIGAKDFAGLRHLRDRLGDRFTAGVVLYTGRRTLSFGERLAAVPLCGLWA